MNVVVTGLRGSSVLDGNCKEMNARAGTGTIS